MSKETLVAPFKPQIAYDHRDGLARTPEQQQDHPLVEAAIEDALSRLPEHHSVEAEARIKRGIRNRLGPTLVENEIIQAQIFSPEYQSFAIDEIIPFLNGAKVGASPCPDGRINPYYSMGDPEVVVFHQRLAGIPETRPSTSSEEDTYVLSDPNITGSMIDSIDRRREKYPDVELVEELGLHLRSDIPTKGCGALKMMIARKQHPAFGMRFGGADHYYKDLGPGFHAFNNTAERILGVKATSFDISHDVYSQGLIFGLRDAIDGFDEEKTLRENLFDMHRHRRIVMTEELGDVFHDQIHKVDTQLYPEGDIIDPSDPHHLAANIMRIGRVAKAITMEAEQNGYAFLPHHLIKDATPTATRVLAYTLIRNTVFRQLAQIKAGHHSLLDHNERSIRIGSSGPINVDHVPFVLRTPSGTLREQDIQEAFALEGILREALEDIGVEAEDEAAIFVVTETYDQTMYSNDRVAKREHEIAYATAGNNAAMLRNRRREDVNNGAVVFLGALIGPDNTFTEITK